MKPAIGLLALFFATAALAQEAPLPPPPEIGTGVAEKQAVTAKDWMVVAAHPLAAEAGARILREGGNAIDAAIAVQLVLGLVEPQSSGLGGGAFLVYWDARTETLTTFDGRETAPMAATPELFLDSEGEPLDFMDAVIGGRSVGTPGTPRLLESVHQRYGSRPWPDLFADAIRLAEKGFAVSPRLAASIAGDAENLAKNPATQTYFFNPDGTPLAAGTVLKNPLYAETLRTLAAQGADAFYSGPIAEDVVSTVRNADNPGKLALDDLRTYRVKEREPVCVPYRLREVCGMGPPSSGALTLGQILGMAERFDLTAMAQTAQGWQVVADASRLAFADRERYMADRDFVPMPVKGLLSKDYLDERAGRIVVGTKLPAAEPGNPKWSHASLFADGEAPELPSTSHFAIVDHDGNVVSMTTTIEAGFGSRLMVRGFLLNNELTDFSFRTHKNGVPVANRVEPGKRPRSSMSPTIVMKDRTPEIALGSPGGSQIIGYVAKTLIAHLDWGLDIQAAVSLPHILNRSGPMEIEKGTEAEKLAPAFEAMGYEVKIADMTSGLHAIVITPDLLTGAADPRREGIAIGE